MSSHSLYRLTLCTVCILCAAAIVLASPTQVGEDFELVARAKAVTAPKMAAMQAPTVPNAAAKPGVPLAPGSVTSAAQQSPKSQGPPTPVSMCLVSGAPVPSANAKSIPTATKNAIMASNNTLNAGPWNPFCEQIHNIKGYLSCKACDLAAGVALGLADAACLADGSPCALVGPEGYAACVAACMGYASYTYYLALVKCVCLHIDCSDKNAKLLNTAPGLYIANSLFNVQLASGASVPATTNAQLSDNPSKVGQCAKPLGGFPPPTQVNGATYGFVVAGGPAVAPAATIATSKKLKAKRNLQRSGVLSGMRRRPEGTFAGRTVYPMGAMRRSEILYGGLED